MAKTLLTEDDLADLDLFDTIKEHSDLEESELVKEVLDTKLDPKRLFTGLDKQALWRKTGGLCAYCGQPLQRGFHGDHVLPWILGGRTTIANGLAACPSCNLSKGSKVW